jgi:hypothetical protein
MPDIRICKCDILATYTYVQALSHGASDAEAKVRGIVQGILASRLPEASRRPSSRRGFRLAEIHLPGEASGHPSSRRGFQTSIFQTSIFPARLPGASRHLSVALLIDVKSAIPEQDR